MDQPFPMEYLVITLIFFAGMTILVLLFAGRWLREKQRLELQKTILERVGSVKDLAEFLTTEQGERFLGTLAPAHFRTHDRTLWSVRVGVVLFTIGVFLMVMLHTLPLGGDEPRVLLLGTLLLIGAGLGMLLSSAVAFLIGRALGVKGSGSKKDGAV
jgi:hypothetical protein